MFATQSPWFFFIFKLFFPHYFCCHRRWTFQPILGGSIHYIYSIAQHLTIFMVFAVSTRSGTGCIWHTSPTGLRPFGILSISCLLLVLIGSGISPWVHLWFRFQISIHHVRKIRVSWGCPSRESNPNPLWACLPEAVYSSPSSLTVHDLKGEGNTARLFPGANLKFAKVRSLTLTIMAP